MTDQEKKRFASEADIKSAVLNHVRQVYGKRNMFLAAEFVVDQFKRRADLVVIGETLDVFEVKSRADSLVRLEGQVDSYRQFFERVTLVVDTRHVKKVLKATTRDVAVWEYENGQLHVRRKGKARKLRSIHNLTTLLSVAELRKLITRLGSVASSKRRVQLRSQAEMYSAKEVRNITFDLIKERLRPNTRVFWSVVGRHKVAPEHLYALSSVRLQRQRYASRHSDCIDLWREWERQYHSPSERLGCVVGKPAKDTGSSDSTSVEMFEMT